MLMAFNSKGLIYRHMIPRVIIINTAYLVTALGTFIKNVRNMWPVMADQEGFFNWENAPLHAAAVLQN